MARTKISEFSATPGDNTDIDGIDIAEGCAPSGINNAIRELMAQLKDMQTGASGDTFTLTTVNSTTMDTTNLEVTNLKAKDGTSAGSIANSTGVVTLASTVLTTTDINGGTVDGTVIGGSSAAAGTFTSINGTSGVISANSSGNAFRITQVGTGNALVVEDSANPDSTPTVIDANGNVGIGTNTPSTPLHLADLAGKIRIGIDGGAQYTDIYRDNSTGYTVYNAAQSSPFRAHVFQVGGTESMRIAESARIVVTKSSIGTPTALTSSSGSIAVDMAAANNFTHTFTENTTLANPTNLTAGQSGIIVFTQHASSPKTLAFGSYWKFSQGTTPTVTASNSAVDVLAYYVESSTRITARLVTDVK
jgi:hypothetical protein